MLEVIIVGAGGFAREVYQWAQAALPGAEYQIKGFLSRNPGDLEGFDLPVGVIGDEDSYEIQASDRFLLAIGDIDIKKRVVGHLKAKGARFLSLIHPTAIITPTARLGEGVIICPFVTLCDHVVLDDFVMMNFYASCGHDARVGSFSILSPYATVNGFGELEDEVFMGTHSTVTARKKVGYRAKVNANSVVMSDIPAHSFVFGVPGRTQTIFK